MEKACLAAILVVSLPGLARAQTTAPSENAAALYHQAAAIIDDLSTRQGIDPPSNSTMSLPLYPPLGNAWTRMEKRDYNAAAQARTLIRRAEAMNRATWPVFDRANGGQNSIYLNECRGIANTIADAALYQSLVLNDQPAAFASMGDLLHLCDLLANPPGANLSRVLVSGGIQAMTTHRLLVMTSGASIAADPHDARDLPLATAREWIARLLEHPDAQAEVDEALKGEPAGGSLNSRGGKVDLARFLEVVRRAVAERDMAAMSLAAHVYQYEHGRWPASIDELKTEMPRLPLDPWGNGKQTLGYLLVQGSLPNGSDRPLVYSRCSAPLRAATASDGLFYRTDEPQYAFYDSDGSNLRNGLRTHAGQFRDVARWAPWQKLEPEAAPGGL